MREATKAEFYHQFELTYEGYPICLNEYTTWIAEEKNTHVIHIDDSFTLKEVPEVFYDKAVHPKVPKEKISFASQVSLELDIGDLLKNEKPYVLSHDRKIEARRRNYFFNNCETKNLFESLS